MGTVAAVYLLGRQSHADLLLRYLLFWAGLASAKALFTSEGLWWGFSREQMGLFSCRERASQNKGGDYVGRMKQLAGWQLFHRGANYSGIFLFVDQGGKHFDHLQLLSWLFCGTCFRPYWWVGTWCQFLKQDSAEQRTKDISWGNKTPPLWFPSPCQNLHKSQQDILERKGPDKQTVWKTRDAVEAEAAVSAPTVSLWFRTLWSTVADLCQSLHLSAWGLWRWQSL